MKNSPNTLAYLKSDLPQNNGRVVHVKELIHVGEVPGGIYHFAGANWVIPASDIWLCEAQGKPLHVECAGLRQTAVVVLPCPDAWLTPINPPGVLEDTETAAPRKTQAEARHEAMRATYKQQFGVEPA